MVGEEPAGKTAVAAAGGLHLLCEQLARAAPGTEEAWGAASALHALAQGQGLQAGGLQEEGEGRRRAQEDLQALLMHVLEGRLLQLQLGPLQLLEQRFTVGAASAAGASSRSSDRSRAAGSSEHTCRTFRLITPADVDTVLDMYMERVRGKRVADLGSGLGVAGIAAALAGAREVVMLDREPLALQCGLLSAQATLMDLARFQLHLAASGSDW
ncbi:uncharacterized protein HaLaN_13485 [Haematococcus lacustris]|uniref:Uncharacterized protein n=1 Tax=Haematococcus lacustris TaxID=44745 RepID=A0A699ZCE0_HAELA|nr:uncharacterized protein HaLaN_13485 [Haematococcus lacustris]